MDIGIDLGTTFSVLAVKGRHRLVDGYPGGQGRYLEECDVTIIPSPMGEESIPSVFWQDPADPTRKLVGTEAKHKAQEGESPILFSKRVIGTSQPLHMNDRTMTGKEVAVEILRYLKKCAEDALGQPVRRAIITYPAYFDRSQIEETREAAWLAGFDMSDGRQMLLDPAAAILSAVRSIPNDPLAVLTYDLGGGTFDVTIVERRGGMLAIKAFDGDHLLGGYNFDRELVQWIRDSVNKGNETGSGIYAPDDEEAPEHRARDATLLQIAETVKVELARQKSATAKVPIYIQNAFVDKAGRTVPYIGSITRQQYSTLIQKHLDRTIECCHEVLRKAELTPERLDYVLLVGGSTVAPWVQERVEKAFPGKVMPTDSPRLCVGIGAALQTAELSSLTDSGGVELAVDAPATSPLPTLNLGGRALREGGVKLAEKAIEIAYQSTIGGTNAISNVLPKSLSLKTADGLLPIAENGDVLPARSEISLRKTGDETSLEIPIYQDGEEVGRVEVTHIPPEAGPGAAVILTTEITEFNEVRGSARVMTVQGDLMAQVPVRIKFPTIDVPEIPELQVMFDTLEAERVQDMTFSDDPERRVLLAGRGRNLAEATKKLFSYEPQDPQLLLRSIKEFARLVRPPKEALSPSRAEFLSLAERCRQRLEEKSEKQLDPFKKAVDDLEKRGIEAANAKNQKAWVQANDALQELCQRIIKSAGGGKSMAPRSPPPTPILKDFASNEIDELRVALANARRRYSAPQHADDFARFIMDRCYKLESQIEEMRRKVDAIEDNLEGKQALAMIQLALRPSGQIKEKILKISDEVEDSRSNIHEVPNRPLDALSGHAGELEAALSRPSISGNSPTAASEPLYLDDNVQFSVYRPRVVVPARWCPMLAFAHLSEPRKGEENPNPQAEVARQATQVLGDQIAGFQDVRADSAQAVPREGEITFVPVMPGVQFNPPRRTFLWQEPVHREEFRLRANPSLDGKMARGSLTVFLGNIILAEIALSIRVDGGHQPSSPQKDVEHANARPYRMIFASYSHKDTAIVEEFERYVERSGLGDRYLRDCRDLRAGEMWNDGLMRLIGQASVFQLFWSSSSMVSPFVRQEWEHALSLGRQHFIRPVYWEEPMPAAKDGSLPPPALGQLHFQRVSFGQMSSKASPLLSTPASEACDVLPDANDSGVGVSLPGPTASPDEPSFLPRAASRHGRDDDIRPKLPLQAREVAITSDPGSSAPHELIDALDDAGGGSDEARAEVDRALQDIAVAANGMVVTNDQEVSWRLHAAMRGQEIPALVRRLKGVLAILATEPPQLPRVAREWTSAATECLKVLSLLKGSMAAPDSRAQAELGAPALLALVRLETRPQLIGPAVKALTSSAIVVGKKSRFILAALAEVNGSGSELFLRQIVECLANVTPVGQVEAVVTVVLDQLERRMPDVQLLPAACSLFERWKCRRALPYLRRVLLCLVEETAQARVIRLLGTLGDKESVTVIMELLDLTTGLLVTQSAVEVLRQLNCREQAPMLAGIADVSPQQKYQIIQSLLSTWQ